jgi:hypothetical protein
VLGLVMATHPDFFENRHHPHQGLPPEIGFLFAGLGAFIVLLGWTVGILTIYSGRCLQTHRHRTFSLVMAAIHCLWMPLGTILGVFTFVVLSRQSVIRLYDTPAR